MWLQNKRDAAIDRTRGPTRRDDAHEYRVGRLKHERVIVPRDESLMDWAVQVMRCHASRKSILEVRNHPCKARFSSCKLSKTFGELYFLD